MFSFSVSIFVQCFGTMITYRVMSGPAIGKQFYSIDAVMFDSKKKKNPNMPMEEKEYEENNKGKKVGKLLAT